jgi:hypothetical protein
MYSMCTCSYGIFDAYGGRHLYYTKGTFCHPHECQEVEKLSKYLLLSPTQPYDYSTLTEQV